ncbi:MAG: ribonucleoside triphosphate reductase [Pelolinea sp.]|jgi:ribonucleoside-triphosphate reductase|nr:ribonucleoside triphosphate reductase [Pelolinea sp.]
MKISQVIKRDGKLQSFGRERIENAVFAAAKAVDSNLGRSWAEMISFSVVGLLAQRCEEQNVDTPSVEQIQDVVEEVLTKSGQFKIAKAYILYRQQRQETRVTKRILLDGEKLIEDYLQETDWRVSENSNLNYSLQGLNFYLASSIASQYWLNKIYPPEVCDSHTNGALHLHDLGALSVYCCGWDLLDLLVQGFCGVSAKVESSPPKHLRTALGQLVNFFYTLQGESAGAVAVSNFDTLLAPFVRHDGLDYAQVKQTVQEFVFNMNVPTRVGFQTPFSNITFDLVVPEIFRNQPIVIGGEYQDTTYGEYQPEMDLINRAFAEVMLAGDAKGRVFTFPIPTYNLNQKFDWDSELLEPIWAMTGKYGIPYFANFINSDMNPDDVRSMCCRLRLDNRELRKRMGGIFASTPLTGSIGVVTVNLPRIAYLSKGEQEFQKELLRLMEISRTSLEIKRKLLEQFMDQQLYPYAAFYLKSVKMQTGNYWSNHFSTIGLIGMNEACQMITGFGFDTDKGKEFAERTMDFMLKEINRFQIETGHLYNLEATPAEGASYRLARIDRKNYPDIIASGSSETPYYTNSTQLPVGFSDDLFAVLDHQDSLQTRYTGGTVLHIFLGEQIDDWKQVRRLVRTVAENYHLPYFTLTPTFSICPVHGYIPGAHTYCPYDHSPEELSRFGVAVPGS